jgi:hypothetical protein
MSRQKASRSGYGANIDSTVALTRGCIHKGQNRTWFSENNRNNTHCCSDKGVALARGGGDGGEGDINLLDPLLWGRQWDA